MPIFLDKTGAPRRARGRDLHAILEISLVLVTARAARTELDDDLHPRTWRWGPDDQRVRTARYRDCPCVFRLFSVFFCVQGILSI